MYRVGDVYNIIHFHPVLITLPEIPRYKFLINEWLGDSLGIIINNKKEIYMLLTFTQYIKNVMLEAKLEHFVNLNLDSTNDIHQEMVRTFNNNKAKLDKKHPAQYKSVGDLSDALSPFMPPSEVTGSTLVHHNKKTGAKVYHVHTSEASCSLGSPTWCTSNGSFHKYDKGSSFILHLPSEHKRNMRKIGIFGDAIPKGEKASGLFQDAANKDIPDDEWEDVVRRHQLDKVGALDKVRVVHSSHGAQKTLAKIKNNEYEPHELLNDINNKRLKQSHIDAIIKHQNGTMKELLAVHHIIGKVKLSDYQINTIANDKNATAAHAIFARHDKSPTSGFNLDDDSRKAILNNPTSIEAHNILNQPK